MMSGEFTSFLTVLQSYQDDEKDGNGRLGVIELRLQFQPPGIDLGTASSASQRLIH